jgi:hypothetical protein
MIDSARRGRGEEDSGMDEQFTQSALDYHRLPTPGKISILPTKGLTKRLACQGLCARLAAWIPRL